jgi:nucleotide-binding universal stress UspA family protein
MRILAATDGSEAATRAVELAARLVKELNGRLKIVHIVTEEDVPQDQLSDYAHSEHSTSAEILNGFSEEKLRLARQRAEAQGVSEVELASLLAVDNGDIADSIMDAAHRNEADIIVLGKRGLSRLAGLLVGSVSQKVVSAAACAVIVVP